MKLFRQRAQRFSQQTNLFTLHCQLIGFGFEQDTFTADDIANIPVFEFAVYFFTSDIVADEDLQATRDILNSREAGFSHHAFKHNSTSDLDGDPCGFQFIASLLGIEFIQPIGQVLARKIIRKRLAGRAPSLEFFPSFGDQMIFRFGCFDSRVGWRRGVFSHDL